MLKETERKIKMTKNKYIHNLVVEQDNQNKILLALEIFFNKLFELEIVENTITPDIQHQMKGIDRLVTLSDGSVIAVDDKNQLSVQLFREPVGKQSDSIYLEYRRKYSTGSTSEGIFNKKSDLIAILTGDNYAIIIDLPLLKYTFEDIGEELVAKYGYDKEGNAYVTHQSVNSRGDFPSYEFDGYYLRLNAFELENELNIAHCFAVVDLQNHKVIM